MQAIKKNRSMSNSGYSSYILKMGNMHNRYNGHYKITEKMKPLEHVGEMPYIKISKYNLHINDINIVTHNAVFRILQEMNAS
jgi:hypothetical protein